MYDLNNNYSSGPEANYSSGVDVSRNKGASVIYVGSDEDGDMISYGAPNRRR